MKRNLLIGVLVIILLFGCDKSVDESFDEGIELPLAENVISGAMIVEDTTDGGFGKITGNVVMDVENAVQEEITESEVMEDVDEGEVEEKEEEKISDEVKIEIREDGFYPGELVIPRGTTVIWVNNGTSAHMVVARDRFFLSERIDPGDTYEFLFIQNGTYTYFDAVQIIDGWGNITVTEEDIRDDIEVDPENYTLDKLREYLISTTNKGYNFNQDEEYFQYYNSNDMKYYVIEFIDESKVYDSKTFYDRFSAKNWGGYLHYLNRTAMAQLRPPLSEENFSREEDYKEYFQQRAFVDQTFIENTIDLEEGKVLEYQGINWAFSPQGYFTCAWQDTLLIYKIYCSPELVIFLRPSWTEFTMTGLVGKKYEIYSNWNEMINDVRPDMLNEANAILRQCPVNKEFFDDLPDEEFKSSENLAYYWKTEYQFYWNLTMDLIPQVEPMERTTYDGYYLLKRVNFSFTNYGPEVLWGSLLLDINTISDGEDEYEFKTEKNLGIKIKSGETIKRDMEADHPDDDKPRFLNNLTINYDLYKYAYGFSIRLKSITIDTNGTIIKEE